MKDEIAAMIRSYQYYNLEDFLQDDSFWHWVNKSDADAVAFWDDWLEANPEKTEVADEARVVIKGIPFNRKDLPQLDILSKWEELESRIVGDSESKTTVPEKQRYNMLVSRAAATLLLLVALGGGMFWGYSQLFADKSFATGPGELQTLNLPDGTEVVLNANSSICYSGNFRKDSPGVVNLEGEAFFSVKKDLNPFLVKTDRAIVQVLGTKFNVNARRNEVAVALTEGKVALKSKERTDRTLELIPGELAELRSDVNTFELVEGQNLSRKTAWKDGLWVFEETPLTEIAQSIEDIYSYKVRFDTPTMVNRKLTGEIEVEELDDLLLAISAVFEIEVERMGETVTFL